MEDDSHSHDGLPFVDEQALGMVLVPPPIHPDDPGPGPLPGSILLNPQGYISDRTNGTTAGGFTKGGKRIYVTFWAAHPPRASCFTVHAPELGRSAIGDIPKILCTEEDLVLLRVPICAPRANLHPGDNDYFVYQTGAEDRPPSLQLILTPPTLFFADSAAALLRCRCRRGDMYFIALLCQNFTGTHFELHLYSSRSASWINKLMRLDSPKAEEYTYTSKAITIGGEPGSVGWTDLRHGILICDLLRKKNHLLVIPLPPPLLPDLPRSPPFLFQDINVFEKGCIKYFDMYLDIGSGLVVKGWEAATWRREVSSTDWEQCCRIEVRNNPAFPDAAPNLQEDEHARPILKGVYSGFPALSLYDDDVVYLMDKYDLLDTKASVIAVDMRNQTLKDVTDFGCGRPFYSFIYYQSAISKYLGLWSSTGY